jgi:hypothetical protein
MTGDISRLYRQAEEGSRQLFERFSNERLPFERAIEAISNGQHSLVITGPEEATTWMAKALAYAQSLSKQVSPYLSLPVILQAVTDFYFGPYGKEPPWLGTALKISLALIWANVHSNSVANSKSLKDVGDLVAAAAVFEQLEGIRWAYTGGEGQAELTGYGSRLSGDLLQFATEMQAAFEKRGQLHRTLSDSVKAIFGDVLQPLAALQACQHILNGEHPQSQKAFEGTIFAEIPGEPLEFWAGLWGRLVLFIGSMVARAAVKGDPDPGGIALIPTLDIPVFLKRGRDPVVLEQAIRRLFWDRNWYVSRVKENPQNMIVERPVMRITRDFNLFVTSTFNIADSITWFVEASILEYPRSGGVPLPKAVFEHSISDRFEQTVKNVLRRHGFQAGEVNEGQQWILEEQPPLKLEHLSAKKLPGQIGILAYHRRRKLVFVVECKVLALPDSVTRLRNIVGKIGEEDSEAFHSKLRRKIEWVQNTQLFAGVPRSQFMGLIVLDRVLPGMMRGDYPVCDLETLERFLAEAVDSP